MSTPDRVPPKSRPAPLRRLHRRLRHLLALLAAVAEGLLLGELDVLE
jgi:hypothetical protein